MRRVQHSLVLVTLFSVLAASSLSAQMRIGDAPTRTDLSPSERTFAEAYLTAVTGSDIERYKLLLHPKTRACMSKENAAFFEPILKRRVGRVPVNPRLSIETLPAKFAMFDYMSARGYVYPVRPTQLFHIEVVSTGSNQSEIGAFAALENGSWYEVLPCPSAKAIADLKQPRG
jgi:hypothetical protein